MARHRSARSYIYEFAFAVLVIALLLVFWPAISDWLAMYFTNSARNSFFSTPSPSL